MVFNGTFFYYHRLSTIKIIKKEKMTLPIRFIALLTAIFITNINSIFSQAINKERNVSLQIDGSKRFQQIDGIGINANTRSWNGKELQPPWIYYLIPCMQLSGGL